MADFAIADVTDSMLDGIIDGFPNTYASKVGKTSDAMYKACSALVFYQSKQRKHCTGKCAERSRARQAISVAGLLCCS